MNNRYLNDRDRDTVEEVSNALVGLIATFDLLCGVNILNIRDITISEFAWFIQKYLDELNQKVNSIGVHKEA